MHNCLKSGKACLYGSWHLLGASAEAIILMATFCGGKCLSTRDGDMALVWVYVCKMEFSNFYTDVNWYPQSWEKPLVESASASDNLGILILSNLVNKYPSNSLYMYMMIFAADKHPNFGMIAPIETVHRCQNWRSLVSVSVSAKCVREMSMFSGCLRPSSSVARVSERAACSECLDTNQAVGAGHPTR